MNSERILAIRHMAKGFRLSALNTKDSRISQGLLFVCKALDESMDTVEFLQTENKDLLAKLKE